MLTLINRVKLPINPLKLFYLFIYFLYLLIVSWYAASNPFYSWDMIPYTALILSLEQPSDKQTLHTKTYQTIKQQVPPQVYAELTKPGYRQEMEQSHDDFHQQLPFYQIRPLYIGLSELLHKTGMNVVTAIVLISVLSSLFMSIIILRWLFNELDNFYAYLFSFLIIHNSGVIQIASAFTPDALSAAILILSMYWLIQRYLYVAGLLLVLAIFARTDNIILVILAFSYLTVLAPNEYRLNRTAGCVILLLSIVSYLAINYLANNYGWATVFYHTFIGTIHNPADFHPNVTWADYLGVLMQNGMNAFYWSHSLLFMLFLGLMTIVLVSVHQASDFISPKHQVYSHLTLLLILSFLIHCLLFPFPVFWQRFFVAHFSIISVLMVGTIFLSLKATTRDCPNVSTLD